MDPLTAGRINVGSLFASTARLHSNRTALIEGKRSLTYGALLERVNCLAGVMRQRGLRRGDRVALLARNCIEYVEVELAAARIGAISVNLNWRFSPQEIVHGLGLTGPGLVIASPLYSETLSGIGRPADILFGSPYEAALASGADTPEPG